MGSVQSLYKEFSDVISVKQTVSTLKSTESALKKISESSKGMQIKKIGEFADCIVKERTCYKIHDFLVSVGQVMEGHNERTLMIKHYVYLLLANFTQAEDIRLDQELVRARVTHVIAQDLSLLQSKYRFQTAGVSAMGKVVETGIVVLKNCATNVDLHAELKDQTLDVVQKYVDPFDNYPNFVLDAIIITQDIDPDHRLTTLCFPGQFWSFLSQVVSTTKYDPSYGHHRVEYPGSSGYHTGLGDVLCCCLALAKTNDYKCIVRTLLGPHNKILDNVLQRGHPDDVKMVKMLMQSICQHMCKRCLEKELTMLPLKHGIAIVQQAPIPSEEDMDEPYYASLPEYDDDDNDDEEAGAEHNPDRCPYMDLCTRFFSSMDIHSMYLEIGQNKCFCTRCMRAREDQPQYPRGTPPKPYYLPKGWAKIGLKPPPRAIPNNIWEVWHVAFHGTSSTAVNEILSTGELLMPEDTTISGRKLTQPKGHFTKVWKPKDFNELQIFVTPSIEYAGQRLYSKPSQYDDPVTHKSYEAKVAFQLRIHPESYKVDKQTIGASTRLDPLIPNEELEWSTIRRGVVILTGILINLQPLK